MFLEDDVVDVKDQQGNIETVQRWEIKIASTFLDLVKVHTILGGCKHKTGKAGDKCACQFAVRYPVL